MLSHDVRATVSRDGIVNRRHVLRQLGVAAGGVAGAGFLDVVRSRAAELQAQGKACILLYMKGGPSQFETFNPKPGVEEGGPTKTIPTTLPGFHIGEDWPNIAQRADDLTIIRSMTHRDANHPSAQFLTHTGYAASGTVNYPSVGSVVAHQIGDDNFDLPNFVCVGPDTPAGSGLLSMKYAPYLVNDPTALPFSSQLPPSIAPERLQRRLELMYRLEKGFRDAGAESLVEKHRAIKETAAGMTLSPRMKAFDIGHEPQSVRELYGSTEFAQGCLLARRLVETGVSFVEVVSFNWDTHRKNFSGQTALAQVVDPAWSTLLDDLKERGMLESTLVIWMGEFGRTPKINKNDGRDHYPRGFCVAMAGCGVKGGQVIGATDEKGADVTDRPVTVPELFSTFYQALGISTEMEFRVDGRPVPIVGEGGKPVMEVFG